MKYSIIIPTYNHLEDCLAPCLESIEKYTDLTDVEVIVVANGCTDGTREYFKYHPFAKVLWYDEPIGYTKAVNIGLEQARGEYIVLLNNDTVLLEQPKNQWLDILSAPLTDGRVGMTGPMQTFCPEAQRDFLIFFCVMIKKSMFDELGKLDEIFSPGYGEDTDFACKMEDAGYMFVQVCPSQEYYGPNQMAGKFPIYHKGNVTFKNYPGGEELIRRNNQTLQERYNPNLISIDKALKCDGYMNTHELRWLADHAIKHNTIIEVGSWHGRSTRALGDNPMYTHDTIYAVDHFNGSKTEDFNHGSAKWENGDHAFMEFCDNNVDLIQEGKVIPIRMSSESAAKWFKKHNIKADMIFIDAGHTYEECKADILLWKDLLTDNGLFCGHDYNGWIGVNQAVEECISNFKVMPHGTIWYCGKNDIKAPKADVYDCFPFNNELDILEKRLSTLWDVVDRFVIVEATRTHGNKPKPLYFNDNLKRFEKYLSKISHIVIDDYPATDSWSIERHQRDCMVRALTQCKDNDIVIVSDADEIPTPEAILSYTTDQGIKAFEMDLFYYNLNTKAADKWNEAKIVPYKMLKEMTPCGVRYTNADKIPNGGQHLSYFTDDVNVIIKKIEDTAHQEYNKPEFKDPEIIRDRITRGVDIFGRDLKFEKVNENTL